MEFIYPAQIFTEHNLPVSCRRVYKMDWGGPLLYVDFHVKPSVFIWLSYFSQFLTLASDFYKIKASFA
jgi:hypothetical protein